MGNEASKGKGHTLGGSSSSSGSSGSGSASSSSQQLQPQRTSSGSNPSLQKTSLIAPKVKAKPANSEEDREQRLAAIEARMGASERRGVQKGGGKLAQKLEENKRTNGASSDAQQHQQTNDVAEMWKN